MHVSVVQYNGAEKEVGPEGWLWCLGEPPYLRQAVKAGTLGDVI